MKKVYFPNWVDDSTPIGQNAEDIKFKLKNAIKKRFTWFPDNKMKFNKVLMITNFDKTRHVIKYNSRT